MHFPVKGYIRQDKYGFVAMSETDYGNRTTASLLQSASLKSDDNLEHIQRKQVERS